MSENIFDFPGFKEWAEELRNVVDRVVELQKPIPRPGIDPHPGGAAVVGEVAEEILISDRRPGELPYTIITGPPRPWFEGGREVLPHGMPHEAALLTAVPDIRWPEDPRAPKMPTSYAIEFKFTGEGQGALERFQNLHSALSKFNRGAKE